MAYDVRANLIARKHKRPTLSLRNAPLHAMHFNEQPYVLECLKTCWEGTFDSLVLTRTVHC